MGHEVCRPAFKPFPAACAPETQFPESVRTLMEETFPSVSEPPGKSADF
jgi:hypothetical protein